MTREHQNWTIEQWTKKLKDILQSTVEDITWFKTGSELKYLGAMYKLLIEHIMFNIPFCGLEICDIYH